MISAHPLAGVVSPVELAMSQKDLPDFFRVGGYRYGAEVGVWRGAFTEALCKVGMTMLAVDPWASYPEWTDSKNDPTKVDVPTHLAKAQDDAVARLSGLECTIVRQPSADAVGDVADRSLDFVFIDANHSYWSVTQDLTLWSPKVRSGGMIAGAGYRANPDKPFIQVKAAVDDYVAAHGINPWYVLTGDRYPTFLWMVR